MFRKWTLLCLILIGIYVVSFGWVFTGMAQDEAPPQDTACRICHQDRYWLNDTGKWYCFCGEVRVCTDCHFGNSETWDIALAHEGVIKNPIAGNPAVCQDCHPQDYQSRIERLAAVAFIVLDAQPEPTHTPYVKVAGEVPQLPALQIQPMKPWQTAALSIIGILFLGIIVYGYICWKADCLSKTIRS